MIYLSWNYAVNRPRSLMCSVFLCLIRELKKSHTFCRRGGVRLSVENSIFFFEGFPYLSNYQRWLISLFWHDCSQYIMIFVIASCCLLSVTDYLCKGQVTNVEFRRCCLLQARDLINCFLDLITLWHALEFRASVWCQYITSSKIRCWSHEI